jgi:putative transposase
MKLNSFPRIVKFLLKDLPTNDYPVLNSRLFCSIWFTGILDKGINSLRDLFYQLNHAGTKVDLSTFSKANKIRDPQIFMHLYHKLLHYIESAHPEKRLVLCPFDATVIPLMSKLFWLQGYRQVKLITTLNQDTKSTGHLIVSPGGAHEINFGEDIVKMLPENGVAVGDRGFCSHKVFDQFIENDALFIIRIKSNWKWDENYHITTERGKVRVVCFGNVQQKVDYYLATNIPEEVMSNEEIGEAYRQRWAIEVLWKFLKMNLKLDKMMSKNLNGITIQIYVILIVYLILQLLKVPRIYGSKLVDKFRYIQILIRQEWNFVHWLNRVVPRLNM